MLLDRNLSRRQALAAFGLAAGSLALGACGAGNSTASAPAQDANQKQSAENVVVRVASLKGPTTMGLVHMMDETSGIPTEDAPTQPAEDAKGITYSYTVSGAPDAVLPLIVKGEADIALVPANAAAVLYNKTQGGVRVIDVNTLGILYVVTGDSSVKTFEDLAGKSVYLSGKGASPEYSLNFLLEQAGIKDQVNIEFKSEHTECAAAIVADPSAVAILPQPFATATLAQNQALTAPISLTDVWEKYVTDGSQFVMGVTIARKDFVEQHPDAIKDFLKRHAESAQKAVDDPAGTAPLVVKAGIVAKEPIAQKALPLCNIVCLEGDACRDALSGYLQVLANADPSSVGGQLPGDDLYFEG